jgi:hypothetical protein
MSNAVSKHLSAKMVAIFFGILLGSFMSSVSYAEIQEFRFFSIDVPRGWEAKADGEKTVILKTKRKTGRSLMVGFDVIKRGIALKDIANAFLNSFAKGATDISVMMDDEDKSAIMYKKDGFKCVISINKVYAVDDDEMIIKYGVISNYTDEMFNIFGSVKLKL